MKSKSMKDTFGIDDIARNMTDPPNDRKRLGRWPEKHAGAAISQASSLG
jgi:hypothetical protein